MVASTLGSPTRSSGSGAPARRPSRCTCGTRPSVVAPMQCSSPRASAGEHVAGVDRALGLAGADHGVQLVDEEDDRPSSCAVVPSTFFRRSSNSPRYLAPASSSAMSSTSTRLSFSVSGTSPLTMRCAGPRRWRSCRRRLADQHRVVLGAPLQHLDGAADLVVAADHRVELALGALGEVSVYFFSASRWPSASGDRPSGRRAPRRWPPPALARQAMAARHAQVAPVAPPARRPAPEAGRPAPSRPPSAAPRCARRRAQQRARAVVLRQHGREHVHRLDVGVVARHREALGLGERLLELAGEFVPVAWISSDCDRFEAAGPPFQVRRGAFARRA